MKVDKNNIIKALRELVGALYRDLHGAYGTEYYEGQLEREIQKVADVFIAEFEQRKYDETNK